MADVMHKETEITEGSLETDHVAEKRAGNRFSWWIPIGVTLVLTITLVPILWRVTDRGETATAKSTTKDTNTSLLACQNKVDVDLLPFLGSGETARADNISWHYPQTLSNYELDNECSACYTRNDEFVCTDGETMIFGYYDSAMGTGAVVGMSSVCINSTLDLSSLGPVQRGKDVILSDIADGFNVSTTYIREEFNLACEVTGVYTDGTDTPLLACKKVDVDLLPFVGSGETVRADNMSWHYPETLSYYELDNECSACYTRNDELVCTDGEKMIFGYYDNATGMGAVVGMSTVCINSTLDLSSLGPVQRGRDIILSDISDGFNVSTTYIRDEFNLACEVTGVYEERDDGADGERGLQQNTDAGNSEVLKSLPFRGGGKDRKFVDKDTLKWIYPEAYQYFGIDRPQVRCYNSMSQLICTDGRSLVYAEFVEALGAYAVLGKTSHCINGVFNPRSATATKRTGDVIADDYLDGIAITREYILENTGLECNPVLVRRALATSGSQCPAGVALKRQIYRQSISGVSGGLDHIHSRSAHSITFSNCSSGYQPLAPRHFSRHTGAGTGEAVGFRFHCKDSFAGTQNPMVRLISSTGNTSSIGRLRTAYVGTPGCFYNAQERRITAAYASCDGYAIDDGIVVPQQQNIDEFWIKCPGSI